MKRSKLNDTVKQIIVDHQIYEVWAKNTGDGLILCKKKNVTILYMNDQAKRMFNLNEETIPCNAANFLKKEEIEALSRGGSLEFKTGKNKLLIYAEIVGQYIVFIINDLTQVEAIKRKSEKIVQLNKELQTIYEQYADDTIFITDRNGIVNFTGTTTAANCGVTKEYLIGKNVYELEKERIFFPSVSVRVLESKQSQVIIQNTKGGKSFVAVGTPVFDGQGKISKVISITRDYSRQIKIGTLLSKIKDEDQSKIITDEEKIRIVTCNDKMLNVVALARLVAAVNSTVLITGETGTGKEVIAQHIYRCSPRADKPFVKVNCGAISPNIVESELFGYEPGSFTGARKEGKIGLVEAANNGTLFLDEVSELPMNQQVKLLQVLQEGSMMRVGGTKTIQLDVRVIAACNKKLEDEVENGTFREDLFYRLNVVPIHIPPLRERRDDIALLIRHFMRIYNLRHRRETEISKEALHCLNMYQWPGNVRELENTVERLIITALSPFIEIEDIPDQMKQSAEINNFKVDINAIIPLNEAIEELEKKLIKMAVDQYGTATKAAEVLGVNQSTISRKIKYYGIE